MYQGIGTCKERQHATNIFPTETVPSANMVAHGEGRWCQCIDFSPLICLDFRLFFTSKNAFSKRNCQAELPISTCKRPLRHGRPKPKNSRTISQVNIFESVCLISSVVSTSLNVEKEHVAGARRQSFITSIKQLPMAWLEFCSLHWVTWGMSFDVNYSTLRIQVYPKKWIIPTFRMGLEPSILF